MRGVMATVGLALLGTAAAQGGCGGEAGSPSWVKPGVFRGTLGGQAVALELGPRDDGEAARYFYDRFGVNIRLKQGRAGTALLLREVANHFDRTVWTFPKGSPIRARRRRRPRSGKSWRKRATTGASSACCPGASRAAPATPPIS